MFYGGWDACYVHIDDVSVTICSPDSPQESSLFVPTAFSPNGDNNNDILYVRGNGIASIDFHVFDRWGQEVFISQNQNDGWDGKYKGKDLQTAVFMYYLNVTYVDGKTETVKGNISLIR
jgi:gliding motility-associated-like protein